MKKKERTIKIVMQRIASPKKLMAHASVFSGLVAMLLIRFFGWFLFTDICIAKRLYWDTILINAIKRST